MLHVYAEDRFWVEAKVNGKRARLIFDTGCSPGVLRFRPAAERLGLKFTTLPPDQRQATRLGPYWITEEFTITLHWSFWISSRLNCQAGVIQFPPYAEPFFRMDGALGWSVVSENIIELDAMRKQFKFLPKVPNKAMPWIKLALRDNLPAGEESLVIEMAKPNGDNGAIIVDTGLQLGVGFPPGKWVEWKTAHTNQPVLTDHAWFR